MRTHVSRSRIAAGAILLVVAARACGQTTIPGGTIINQTWTAANSPYHVMGDITIPMGSFLTIQPGVIVRFASADATGAGVDPLRIELTAIGALTIQTTTSAPVTFQAISGTSPHTWHGIVLAQGGVSGFTASNLIVRHAHHAFTTSRDTFTLDRAVISDCSGAALLSNRGTSTLTDVEMRDVGYGVWARNNGSTTLTQCWIRGFSIDAVLASLNSSGQVLIYWTTVDSGSGNGVHVQAMSPTDFPLIGIYSSMVTRCQGRGVWRDAQSFQAIILTQACNFWGNAAGDLVGVTAGPGCISADPLYKPGLEPRLRGGSLCVDRGAGSSPQLDLFGNPRFREGDGHAPFGLSDIGCYEVPCFANCDESSVPPVLNVLDFNCFLGRFAAGEPWANCDGSSVAPQLNVLDFNCFLSNFAGGCPGQ